jgi:cytochrome P450
MQGTATVMSMDGPEHLQRKAAIMSCFTDQRLDGFVRLWGRLLDAYVNRWAALEHFSFAPQLIRLHAEFALASVLGAVDVAPRQLAKLSRRMVRAVKSSEGMPLNVPGMGLWRSNKARRGLERCALEQVRRERQTHGGSSSNAGLGDDEKKKAVAEPAEVDVAELAVVRTMAHVKDPETGELLPEEVVASELTNMLIHTMGNGTQSLMCVRVFAW